VLPVQVGDALTLDADLGESREVDVLPIGTNDFNVLSASSIPANYAVGAGKDEVKFIAPQAGNTVLTS
jgi:hypothetical protein